MRSSSSTAVGPTSWTMIWSRRFEGMDPGAGSLKHATFRSTSPPNERGRRRLEFGAVSREASDRPVRSGSPCELLTLARVEGGEARAPAEDGRVAVVHLVLALPARGNRV